MVEMAMIPSKEARELLYSLLAENFVSLQVPPVIIDNYSVSLYRTFSPLQPHLKILVMPHTLYNTIIMMDNLPIII